MFNWLKGFLSIFQKKKNNCCEVEIRENTCETCVWWKAEEENNAPPAHEIDSRFDENYRFCDIHKNYSHKIHGCFSYVEERFEATDESIQTEEYELNTELSVEESESNDTRREKK